MRFDCIECDNQMSVKRTEVAQDSSTAMLFVCPKCGKGFKMKANPMEAKAVSGLKAHLSAGTSKSFDELTDEMVENAKEELSRDTIVWEKDAEAHLTNIPLFARPMAKEGIESYARQKGYRKITLDVMAEARKIYGM